MYYFTVTFVLIAIDFINIFTVKNNLSFRLPLLLLFAYIFDRLIGMVHSYSFLMNLLNLNGVYSLMNLVVVKEGSLKLIDLLLQGLFYELIFLLPLVILLDV